MRLPAVIALVALGLVGTAPAYAAPPKPETADTLTTRGVELYKKQDYDAARIVFARAYELSPRTAILFNLALAEVQSGHGVEAVTHFRSYIGAPDAEIDKREATLSKWLPRAESQSGLLRIDAPAGSEVLIDEARVGSAPIDSLIPVEPGEHRVEAHGPAFHLVRVVHANRGLATVVVFEQPAVPSVASNTLAPRPQTLEPAAERGGNQPSTAKIVTVASIGGTALVAGAMAVAFAYASQANANRAESLREILPGESACATAPQPPACSDLRQAIDGQYTNRNLAYGLALTAGILVVADVAILALWPKREGKETALAHVRATPLEHHGMLFGWQQAF